LSVRKCRRGLWRSSVAPCRQRYRICPARGRSWRRKSSALRWSVRQRASTKAIRTCAPFNFLRATRHIRLLAPLAFVSRGSSPRSSTALCLPISPSPALPAAPPSSATNAYALDQGKRDSSGKGRRRNGRFLDRGYNSIKDLRSWAESAVGNSAMVTPPARRASARGRKRRPDAGRPHRCAAHASS
jgi:hypothetical protein